MENFKKIMAYGLALFVVLFTGLAILGIWEIVNFEKILSKSFQSLLVVFGSSAILLFIFNVLIKDKLNK